MNSLYAQRSLALDDVLTNYDFGDNVQVESLSGWEWTSPGDIYTRKCYVSTDSQAPHEPSIALTFLVRFHPGTAHVAEQYATDRRGNTWGIGTRPLHAIVNPHVINTHIFKATELLGLAHTPHYHAFRLSVLSAIGDRVLRGNSPFVVTAAGHSTSMQVSFYPDEHLILPAARVNIILRTKNTERNEPAVAAFDIEYDMLRHKRLPLSVQVVLPDELLGVQNFLADSEPSYGTLYWNLSAETRQANLFEVLPLLACAYAQVEESDRPRRSQARNLVHTPPVAPSLLANS